jgi:hypothetical protein
VVVARAAQVQWDGNNLLARNAAAKAMASERREEKPIHAPNNS